ncbi:carboxymuconolactone decarboxylase family protein [Candidatus Poriferisodalis sp.]|uniref:carboxymuconolactone decarboxylase family protein n=1 Tax=Candidatus Poriferisodalis sp. TaxID=3101277 RepID=UPI003B02D96A
MHLPRPTTPRLEPIPKVAARAREVMESSFANAVNVLATMAHNRTISKALGEFAQTILFKGDLSRRDVEIAVLRMGWNCQSVYEFGQHTLMARAEVMTDEEIYLVTRPIAEGNWTPAEAAVLQVVDDLYADDCVSDATWAEAASHFNEAELVHLIAAAGCYRMVSGFLNSAGVQRDEGVPGWPTAPSGRSGD